MLTSLHIRNVALIEEMAVEFHEGLNILSGETGAGKSMIIKSLQFVLGGRPSEDFIRKGADQALVEGAIYVKGQSNRESVAAMGIEMDEDNLLLIRRSVTETGKTSCRVNGRVITIGMLRELASSLFDLHGQHEHQSLLDPARHIELLDKFCPPEMSDAKARLMEELKKHREYIKSLQSIGGDTAERETRIEVYQFQVDEIETAALTSGEEEQLLARRKVLGNSEMIAEKTEMALANLSDGGNGERAAIDKLALGRSYLAQLAELDGEALPFSENIENIYILLDDLIRDVDRYADNIEHDPMELEKIENRMDLIYRLKRKYGSSIEEILSYLSSTKEKLNMLLNSEALIEEITKKKDASEKKILELCAEISQYRQEQAGIIATQVEVSLQELGMKDARFSIIVEPKEEFGPLGYDKVEFMISPNAGEECKPLAKIASGGEISRVMLALKTVLADADTIETFVFDEIDTGVSGRTAQKVAEKLSLLSHAHQILCITHLPQIASMGNAHFLIEKKTRDGKTMTHVFALDEGSIISELARLIGGAKITEATLKAAEEMKDMAALLK